MSIPRSTSASIGTPEARALKGKAAIANARLAHQAHEQMTAGSRWQALAATRARPQRPLWASTGVKNAAYPDTMYVSELVIAGTVNTMPGATLEAFADHGVLPPRAPAGDARAAATAHFEALKRVGVDFTDVTDTLERQGLTKFEDSWTELTASVDWEMRATAPAAGEAGTSKASPKKPLGGADLLAIYLNDHLSGATGPELFRPGHTDPAIPETGHHAGGTGP